MEDKVTFFSGLMLVHNADSTNGWYKAIEENQPGGGCGTDATGQRSTTTAFTIADPDFPALYGLTWCPQHFQPPTTKSLDDPQENPGLLTVAQIELYRNTGGVTALHKFVHLVNQSEKIPLSLFVSMRYI